jgi:hypothetical protein
MQGAESLQTTLVDAVIPCQADQGQFVFNYVKGYWFRGL